jgi:hypothetical protein
MITITLIILIIAILLMMMFNSKGTPVVEKLIDLSNTPNNERRQMMAPKIDPNFIEAKFHSDYMDVITSFNNLSPNQRQIFNINNVPCAVTKGVDVSKVGGIVDEFIGSLNEDMRNNVPTSRTSSSGWDEILPEHSGESGWEKVQRQLGLPISLFNKPKMNMPVKLTQFSDITKYETENETKYACKIIIAKKKVKDELVVKLSFVVPKGLTNSRTNIIIEHIDVIGYITSQGLGMDRLETDDFYYFDSLEKNNMITGKTVATEMMKKYNIKKKVMQERIDGMDIDTQEKYYNTPSQTEYDTYKMTQTVFDDMFGQKNFD